MTENMMEGLQSSIELSVQQLVATKDLNERKVISKTIKNLSDTIASILATAEMLGDLEEFPDLCSSVSIRGKKSHPSTL